jgi:phosphoenolpyruvate carboxylase
LVECRYRDGNPNVTPNVTREVCLRNRIRAATLLKNDLGEIAGRLSTTFCSDELREKVGKDARAPYRAYIAPIIAKLGLTIEWAEQELKGIRKGSHTVENLIETDEIYLTKKQLADEIMLMYNSLHDTGNSLTAGGLVLDLIRNLSAFGLTLCPLDVRQESTRHTEALDAITKHLGVGSYAEWDEATKLSWLQAELSSKRPLIRSVEWENNDNFSETVKDTLDTFKMISEQHDDSLNAYVISQATTASDVLAVLLLQIDAGVKNPLRVVPLFETLDDLKGASETMNTLFNLPVYRASINGKQEVMIGYSDSAKDAGRLAASWAQYETQEALANVAKDHNVDLTFFHGKGGTVGRGGNPATFKAILAHAPDTINGKFRVTEQGEMIYQNFGHSDRAQRTLDIYTAAICAEKHTDRPSPTDEWRTLMNKLSDISCDAYRQIVREDERFVPYFRSATPELELSSLNIGSRPAKRNATGGVESLRAIVSAHAHLICFVVSVDSHISNFSLGFLPGLKQD